MVQPWPCSNTIPYEIMEQIRLVRTKGYSISDEELEIGLRSIAVPVRNGQGALVAALSLSVATNRLKREELVERLLPELEAARRNFSVLL